LLACAQGTPRLGVFEVLQEIFYLLAGSRHVGFLG
jgi:hypothetical protein